MKSRNTNISVITILTIAITAMLGLFATNCKKIEPERLIIVKTGEIIDVSQTSCVLSATLLDVGGDQGVTQYGFCFSLTSNIADIAFCSEKGSKKTKGEYTDVFNGLTPGTSYHTWAYASGDGVTEYGKSLSFETPPVEKPTLETVGPSLVTFNSAHSGGNILSNGGSGITARGICWNTSPTPTIAHLKTTDGTGTGEFGSNLTELEPEIKYYIRAYATNSEGTGYGNELTFTTPVKPVPPELTTNGIEEITWNSAVGGGNITSDGGSEITERGLCWGLNSNPTKADFFSASGGGVGGFVIQMTELTPETGYYVRAYAINSGNITYGNEQVFNTNPEPVEPYVVTAEVNDIGPNSAHCGGSIDNDGGAPIISKGFCWSKNPNPTLADANIEYVNGTDPYDMEIQGLDHDTEYFVRAYATNSHGKTGYGNQQIFRTHFLCGSILQDPRGDLQEYATVPIGEQCWMGQNLNVGQMVDTSLIQGDNGTLEKYCYDNDINNCDVYGGQYTWDEMMQFTTAEMAQGVCPDRWHIPSDDEWKILETWLGMQPASLDSVDYRGNSEGGLLKSTATPPWNEPNFGAIDPYQFSALPAGMVWYYGLSTGEGDFTVFWTSTFIDAKNAVYRMLHTNESRISRKDDGYRPNTTSVRCVKD